MVVGVYARVNPAEGVGGDFDFQIRHRALETVPATEITRILTIYPNRSNSSAVGVQRNLSKVSVTVWFRREPACEFATEKILLGSGERKIRASWDSETLENFGVLERAANLYRFVNKRRKLHVRMEESNELVTCKLNRRGYFYVCNKVEDCIENFSSLKIRLECSRFLGFVNKRYFYVFE